MTMSRDDIQSKADAKVKPSEVLYATPGRVVLFFPDAFDGKSVFPDEDSRPQYVVLHKWATEPSTIPGEPPVNYQPGVYHCFMTKGTRTENPRQVNQWVCAPLEVVATVREGTNDNYGQLLKFQTRDKGTNAWCMPLEMLKGAGDEFRGVLLKLGLRINHDARDKLRNYVSSAQPDRLMQCTTRIGWTGNSFAFPDGVIGPDSDSIIFQSPDAFTHAYSQAGTLQGWLEAIGLKARGNTLLILALSGSFAAPLLAKCSAESGGLHLVGESSTGKTTAIEAACSIWGGDGYKKSWRTTSNGLEGVAAMSNDCLLALDEISECSPHEIGAIVYSLGNGVGKQRADRTGAARAVKRWRCFVLSTGERTIETSMRTGGHKIKAGQSVRLLDIEVKRKYGAWDELHGSKSPAAFSDSIRQAASINHGKVGRAFIEKLAIDKRDFPALLEDIKADPLFSSTDCEGQDRRAAARFALIAMAGEIATGYGLTGWDEKEALEAAGECFQLWKESRGSSNRNSERKKIAEQVSDFIDLHGDSRFSSVDLPNDPFGGDRDKANLRAGWYEDIPGLEGSNRVYLFNGAALREALNGFDFRRGQELLQEIGALPAPGYDGKRAKNKRIHGRLAKVYPVNHAALDID